MSRCDVYLENYLNYYTPGQTIAGYVQVTLDDEKQIKGIDIKFKGEAKTHWNESESHYNSTTKKNERRNIQYTGRQEFFKTEINLLRDTGNLSLGQGVHKYPFNFTLPHVIPSSFNGSVGSIKYVVKGEVHRPFLKFDYEAESPFNIVSIIDFNRDYLQTREPVFIEKSKEIGVCCWKSGPISFELTIPASGFAIGQNVPIDLRIENLSNSSISEVKFQIKEEIEFIATLPRHRTRHSYDKVAQKKLSGVGAHGERTYNEFLTIPTEFSAPNLQACNIINNNYNLEVVAVLPCPHSNIKATIPIKIGHVAVAQNNTSGPPLGHTGQIGQIGFVGLESPPSYNPALYPPPVPSMPVAPYSALGPSAPFIGPSAPSVGPSGATAPLPYSSSENELIDWVEVEPNMNTGYDKDSLPPTYEEATVVKKY